MTKSNLVNLINEKIPDLSAKEVEVVLNTLIEKMIESLSKGHRIEIRGFGTFEMRTRKSRQARNPKSGQKVFLMTRKIPFFKVGKELKERINQSPLDDLTNQSNISNYSINQSLVSA